MQNVLNVTAADLANISQLNFRDSPTATNPLIINVITSGSGNTFTWPTPNFNSFTSGAQPYLMWNFPSATSLTLGGFASTPGTIFAPLAAFTDADQNGVLGGVVAASYTQGSGSSSGGPIQSSPFAASLTTCSASSLEFSASADRSSVGPGGTVQYTITATNTGSVAYTGATFTAALGGLLDDATYNGNAAATAGTVSYSSPNLTWTGNLAAGATATITFSATAKNPDPGNGILAFTITSATTGNNCPTGSTDPGCLSSVTVAGLTITQTTNVSTVAPAGTVQYTVTLTNSGQTPFGAAAFSDPLSAVLDDANYNHDGAATSGTVTFSSPTLSWTGSLAVGATATITFSVTAKNPDTGNGTLTSTITSATTGSNCPSGGTDTRCTATVTVSGLTITNTAGAGTATPGSTVSYTVTISNTGQTAYTSISVTDGLSGLLDDATYNGNASATAGSLSFSSPNLTWTGNLAVGATATVTFTATVKSPDTGDKSLVSVITSAAAGSNCPSGSSDSRCTATVTVLVPALTITKTADVSTTSPGSVVHYTITVTNSGQVPYTGASFTDSLSSVLSDAAYNSDAAATAGTVSYAAPVLSWTGDLAVGGTVTITYSVTVDNPVTGEQEIDNTVTSDDPGSTCPAADPGPDCSVSVIVLIPELTITKAADVTTASPGDTVTYTITATDTGETPYTGATITDPLTNVIDDADYNGDATATSGTVSFASPDLTWTGDLAVGGTVTITYSVAIGGPDEEDETITNTAVSADPGSTCPPSEPAGACTASVLVLVPALAISKTADATQVVAGQRVSYSIVLDNTGEVAFPAANITDPLSGVLSGASYDADATATSGTVTVSDGTLSWTGSLPLGGTAVISYSVTTTPSDPDGTTLTNTVSSTSFGSNCPDGSADPGCTATVSVIAQAISLSNLTSSFTLTGPPGTTAEQDNAVSFLVDSNSPDGYTVTVQPDGDGLTSPGTSDTIPMANLSLREAGQVLFQSRGVPVLVHSQSGPSTPGGDELSNDYQVSVPDVRSGAYQGTVEYIATATP